MRLWCIVILLPLAGCAEPTATDPAPSLWPMSAFEALDAANVAGDLLMIHGIIDGNGRGADWTFVTQTPDGAELLRFQGPGAMYFGGTGGVFQRDEPVRESSPTRTTPGAAIPIADLVDSTALPAGPGQIWLIGGATPAWQFADASGRDQTSWNAQNLTAIQPRDLSLPEALQMVDGPVWAARAGETPFHTAYAPDLATTLIQGADVRHGDGRAPGWQILFGEEANQAAWVTPNGVATWTITQHGDHEIVRNPDGSVSHHETTCCRWVPLQRDVDSEAIVAGLWGQSVPHEDWRSPATDPNQTLGYSLAPERDNGAVWRIATPYDGERAITWYVGTNGTLLRSTWAVR